MSAITRDEVQHLAALAQIDLTDSEVTALAESLSETVETAAKVSEVAKRAGDVPEMSHPVAVTNNLRTDEVSPSLSSQHACACAPAVEKKSYDKPHINRKQTI